MNPFRGLAFAAAVMIAAASPAASDAPKVKSPADLAFLVEYALDNSPLLKSLSAEAEASASRTEAAREEWYPRLEAAFSHAQVSPIADSGAIDETWWNVSARQRILDFGRTSSMVKSLKSRELAQKQREKRARQALQAEVAKRYYDYLLALEAVDVYLQTNAIAYVHWDRDREKHGVGLVSRRQMVEKELIYRREKLNLTSAEQEAVLRLNLLQEVIGAPVGDYFEVERAPENPPEIDLPGLEELEREALSKRPEMAMLDARIDALRARLAAVKSEYFPTVEGVAETGDSSRDLLSVNRWKVGVEAQITLFDGFTRDSRMDEIEARIRSLEFDRETQARRVRMEVRQAHSRLAVAEHRVLLAKARIKKAQENLDYARSEYELDLLAELGDAFAEYAKARMFQMRTNFNLRLDLMTLALAVGDDPLPLGVISKQEERQEK
ncbi:MAG: TolC family protein [Candidatus Nitrospinota bacterium M3_3B_026]